MKKRMFEKILKLLSTILLIFATSCLTIWIIDSNRITNIAEEILKEAEIKEDLDNNIISVNFDNLTKTNKDTIGWLSITNTNISYPVVQSKDNDYYLTHNFYNENSDSGWLFADYRNSFNNLSQNIIIYGHNRIENTMFGTLKNLLKEEWYTKDQTIYFNTLNKKMAFKVFSIYTIKAEDFISTTSYTKEELDTFITKALEKSIYDFNVNMDNTDTIITLYTCTNNNKDRIIIHAKKLYQE
jgi:sortase B